MQIQRDDLDDATQEGILSPEQADALWKHLRERHGEEGASGASTGIDAAQIAYYAGTLIVMGAMGWFATEALEQSGALLLPIGLAYAALFGGAGHWLMHRKGLHVPGGLLFTVAVGMTPLAVYGLQHALGIWPPDEPSEYWTFYEAIGGVWVPAKAATLIVSVLVLRFVRFPVLVALVAASGWALALDVVPLLLGAEAEDWGQLNQSISVGVGLVTLAISLLVDRRNADRGFAFWGYLFGLFAFWGGLTAMDASSEWSRFGYFLINVGLIGISVLLQRRVFLVFGALGAYGYLGYLSYDLFADSLWFTFALTALGASLIAAGVFYQRHRERIEQRARSWMGLNT
jgi:hypothetical protein